jgi:hypothetical protein
VTEPNSPVDARDLELLRAEQGPDRVVRARVRSRLAGAIPIGGGGSSGDGGPGTDGPAPSRPPSAAGATGSLVSYGTAAVAFLAGGVVGAALYAGLAKTPSPQVVYVDRPVVVSAPPAAPPSSEPAPVPQTSPAAPVTSAVARSIPPKSRASQLSAERVLLDEARSAIAQGDSQRGLDHLERHRRLFPNALLAEERDALQVQALVKAGRYDDARARADSFRRRTPGSLFLPTVDAAIGSIP